MKMAAQMLNDNSNIVRQAAAVALTKCSAASNTLFPIEKAHIRMIIAMLEDSLQQNRQESLQLIQRTLVDDVQHAKLLLSGMATAATNFPQDRPLFIASAQEFGKNNWYYFHLAVLKSIHIIPQAIDLYTMETVIPFVALFAARKVHSFPLPKTIAKYEGVIDSIIEGCYDATRVETRNPANLEEMKALISDNPRNEKFFLFEVGNIDDAVSLIKEEKPPLEYAIETDESTGLSLVNRLKVELLQPKAPTTYQAIAYTPNVNLFFDVIAKVSYPVSRDLFVNISSSGETYIMQKMENDIYKASPKIMFFNSFGAFKVELTFGFIDEGDQFIPISKPNQLWFQAAP